MGTSHWIDADRVWDKVIVLTDDVLYVANPRAEQAPGIAAALDSGDLPSMVIKDDPEVITLASVMKITYNRNEDDIEIEHKPGKEKESKNLSFSNREERDSFAAQIAERLPDLDSKVVEYGKLRAALSPLAFGVVVALATWGLHAAAGDIAAGGEVEIHGRHALVKRMLFWVMDVIGPMGVLIVGGGVMALTVAVLVSRIKTPPIMHTLKRKKS